MENGKGYLYRDQIKFPCCDSSLFLTDQIQVNLLLQNSS